MQRLIFHLYEEERMANTEYSITEDRKITKTVLPLTE